MPCTPHRPRILLAEDEAPLRNLVGMSLNPWPSSHGSQRWRGSVGGLPGGQFDLVVLDVMMPRIDGFTVCEDAQALRRPYHADSAWQYR